MRASTRIGWITLGFNLVAGTAAGFIVGAAFNTLSQVQGMGGILTLLFAFIGMVVATAVTSGLVVYYLTHTQQPQGAAKRAWRTGLITLAVGIFILLLPPLTPFVLGLPALGALLAAQAGRTV